MVGRVLIVAGSDSGGGAGIQADIKTVTALGGYAATAITALTAQDTRTVHDVLPVPTDFIARQIEVVLDDIGADCIKTGMLHDAPVIETVADALARRAPSVPLVADPVMVAKGGAPLLAPEAVATYRARLLPRAALLTPNLPEAEVLIGDAIAGLDDMIGAGRALRDLGAEAVLVKGGHGTGPEIRNVLVTADGVEVFESPRIDTPHTHGTGCTLASAIAAGIAEGRPLVEAVGRALAYVEAAVRAAPGLGHGHGPLAHWHTVRPFEAPRRK